LKGSYNAKLVQIRSNIFFNMKQIIILSLLSLSLYSCKQHKYKYKVVTTKGTYLFDTCTVHHDTLGFQNTNGTFVPITTTFDSQIIDGLINDTENF